jgi:aspartate/methionine/tyrosine aminotransferase
VRSDEVASIAAERALAGLDLLPLKGSMSAPLPAHVREAVAAALDDHDASPPSQGHPALREAIARTLPSPADPETEILVTNGAMHALNVVFRALLDDGGEVLVPTPTYFFGGVIERAGGVQVEVPGSEVDGWRWDADAVERAVTPRSRALVLCNPGNPTGHLPAREEVDALLDVAERHGLTVVTDEAYERCIYEGALASAFGRDDVVLVRSLGKSLAMPTWRVGFVAGPAWLVAACLRELEWDVIRVNHVVQRAATAGLDGPQDWLEVLAERYLADRDAAHAVVADDPILDAALPAATPFLWLALGEVSVENLLAAGVAVVDGRAFGAPGYARLPFGGAERLAGELRRRLSLATLRGGAAG